MAEKVGAVKSVLATLEYKGSETQFIPLHTALHNFLGGKAVSLAIPVSAPYSAIQTVIFANIADFDKSPYINGVPVNLFAYFNRLFTQVFFYPGLTAANQLLIFGK